ncbi:MFS-type transporter involved in bile tolerance (Atg22 family) [Roseimicrobium gellanilyticum]|uniref:MFS-type transporter involved in bile tolerance (Atg22 family) n=1 Tax=Roseimicrobium gellanilyticum TaxID=748857 RepID=A0A366HNI4_9BACT|nr:MFS transporter [Roseimicrobium gellanilyticum]RBP44346.1 MFS-type transporter involved in bile tolerance (Atg22 family) [Roseimicrobium gellanilyticum]
MSEPPPPSHSYSSRILWGNVILAALLMLATLPGRTQGLGLITEPMLADLQLDRITYANINLWATLLGAAVCLPAGWVIDRVGLRWTSALIVLALALVVWRMSGHLGSVMVLFTWVLLTRAFGQSALSVASITTVGKGAGTRVGMAMGVYSVLIIVFFSLGFVAVGWAVREHGWRSAWSSIALSLAVVVAPLTLLLLREPTIKKAPADACNASGEARESVTGLSLGQALATPVFWVFAGATALFNLAASGLGLFNEAVLAEAGFNRETYHLFLPIMTLFTLLGQGLCGWLTLRRPMAVLLGVAMFLYALGLVGLPFIRTLTQLWLLAGVLGLAAGFITVIFFAIWSQAFGRAQLGRIQGAAQMLTVLASAVGPLLFATCHEKYGSYAPALYILTPLVILLGLVACRVTLPSIPTTVPAVSLQKPVQT